MKSCFVIPRKFLDHLLLALSAACLLILPDHLYGFVSGKGQLLSRPYTLAVLFVISFLLLALRRRLAV